MRLMKAKPEDRRWTDKQKDVNEQILRNSEAERVDKYNKRYLV